MSKYTIAIDNGTTGTIAILGPDTPFFDSIPTKEYLLGKAGKVVRRIDWRDLSAMIFQRLPSSILSRGNVMHAFVERPFTGGPMFVNVSTLSARAHEAVMIVLEQLAIGTATVDSKEWQAAMLGTVKGSPALKKASMLRGMAMYPQFAAQIKAHGDADALMMAHYYHNK
jgi:hypothetical protein